MSCRVASRRVVSCRVVFCAARIANGLSFLAALVKEDLPPISSSDVEWIWWIFGSAVFATFLCAVMYNLKLEKKEDVTIRIPDDDDPAEPEPDPSFATKLFS
jgi:hypothetical protein